MGRGSRAAGSLGLTLLLAAGAAPVLGSETKSPPEPAPYDLALEHYRSGEIDAAAALLAEVVESGQATAAHHVLLGWCLLRGGEPESAARSFAAALDSQPESPEALAGVGLARLRAGRPGEAIPFLRRAVELDPANHDAWQGLGLALDRKGDLPAAIAALATAVELDPSDLTSAARLEALRELTMVERAPRPSVERDGAPEVHALARAGGFEVRDAAGWRPLFVKGVNLGTALPGRFPAEFPDDETLYRRWFDQMGELGANVVRLYTLHPPSLYRALAAHNRERPEQKLWLMQGVWTELPPEHDYDAAGFRDGFHAEIRRVIHALHGNLELPRRPGHAHGIYDTDLGEDLLAWLLGREWEPYSVDAYNRLHPAKTRYDGDYVVTRDAQPIESWLAAVCDFTVAFEAEYYGWQRPVGYTSWPTLDPLVHPTEATVAEEIAIRTRLGRPTERPILEYDNDLINIDSTVLHATERFPAGIYAAYHAYPYYPDFMVVDPGYGRVSDDLGVNRYLAYLQELKEHHGEQPVVIAEFGVPSSRGIAHLQPEGLHHGGHTTREQGEVNARMLASIHEAGLAGGVLFAWMDEWFKKNWIVLDFESPFERNPLWLNVLDAEQNYGLLAAWPGNEGWTITLDGKDEDWRDLPALYRAEGPLRALQVTSDEAYLYVALQLGPGGGPIDWSRRSFWIGIDTYDAVLGDHRFPRPVDVQVPIGLEFLLQLAGPESRLLVDRPYDLFSHRYERPYRSVENDAGDFIAPWVETNRERFGRDGTRFAPRGYDRGALRRGSTDPGAPGFDTLADWMDAPDGSLIEARIPWGLLHVTDPSSLRVVHEESRRSGSVETRATEGFRFHVLALDVARETPVVADSLPGGADPDLARYPVYSWPGWETPTYHLRLKQSYFVVQEALRELDARRPTAPVASRD